MGGLYTRQEDAGPGGGRHAVDGRSQPQRRRDQVVPPMRVAVLTVSDSVSRGEREDLSGPAVVGFCRGLGWEIVATLRTSDDAATIRDRLTEWADSARVNLILTTGSPRIVPRATSPR